MVTCNAHNLVIDSSNLSTAQGIKWIIAQW